MARKLKRVAVLLMLGALALPAAAQMVPQEVKLDVTAARRKVEHRCPGCDCLEGECFTPACDCTLPVTQEWANGMLAATVRVLSPVLNGFDGHEVGLHLILVDPMAMSLGNGELAQGLYRNGLLEISNQLTRRQAGAVIAHEFGHAWHDVHNPLSARADATQAEGFAEWVAYQALRRFGDQVGAESITTNIDPVYGGGFRFYRELEKEHGVAEVLSVAAGWTDLKGTRVPEELMQARAAELSGGALSQRDNKPARAEAPAPPPTPERNSSGIRSPNLPPATPADYDGRVFR